MTKTQNRVLTAIISLFIVSATFAQTNPVITVKANEIKATVQPTMYGIFFEDINYSADGGLYAELIQNRSFDYQATERTEWNPLTNWTTVQRGGGKGWFSVDGSVPLHPNNPTSATVIAPGNAFAGCSC